MDCESNLYCCWHFQTILQDLYWEVRGGEWRWGGGGEKKLTPDLCQDQCQVFRPQRNCIHNSVCPSVVDGLVQGFLASQRALWALVNLTFYQLIHKREKIMTKLWQMRDDEKDKWIYTGIDVLRSRIKLIICSLLPGKSYLPTSKP